jgi:hypothetical protein
VHRDLKPANILVNPEGRVRVIDFGIARVLDAADGDSVTRAGEVVGTLRYLAPEQLHGRLVDARMDVYALGVLAYELIHGRSPYGATISTKALLVAIERHAIAHPKPADRAERDLNAVLTRALEMDPAARYESMAAFARDLRALAQGNRVDARPSSTLEDLVGLATRHPIQVALGLLLVVAISIGLVVSTVLVTKLDEEAARGRISMVGAAIARKDTQTARSLLNEFAPSERTFEYRLLEREVSGSHQMFLDDGTLSSNHYDILPVRDAEGGVAVTVGGGRLTVLDLESEQPIARYRVKQNAKGTDRPVGELVKTLVAPESTPADIRLVGRTSNGDLVFLRLKSARNPDPVGADEVIEIEASQIMASSEDEHASLFRGFGFLGDRLVVARAGDGIGYHTLSWDDETLTVSDEDEVDLALGGEVTAIAPLPNDTGLIVGTIHGRLEIIDAAPHLAAPSVRRTLPSLREPIARIVVSPNGRFVVACGKKRNTMGLDLDADSVVAHGLTDRGRTWNASFSPDSSRVALTGHGGKVRIVDTDDWSLAHQSSVGDGITWSSIWNADHLLVTTERNGVVSVEVEQASANSPILAMSPDGRSMLHIDGRTLIAEDRTSGLHQWFMLDDADFDPSEISAAAIRTGWSEIDTGRAALGVVATRDGRVHLLYDTGRIDAIPPLPHPISRVQLDRTGVRFACTTERPACFLGSIQAGTPPLVTNTSEWLPPLDDRSDAVLVTDLFESGAAGPNRDAGSILAGTQDGRLITLDDGKRMDAAGERFHGAGWIHAYAQSEQDVCFIGDHNGLVSRWEYDGTAWQPIWPEFDGPEVEDGPPLYPDPRRRSAVVDIALHPTEPRLVAMSLNGLLDVYDTDSGALLCTLGPIDGDPLSVVIQEDTLIVRSRGGRIRQWAPSDADAKVESGDLNPEPSTR